MRRTNSTIAIVVLAIIFLSSCTDGINELQETIYSAEDHSSVETEFFSTIEIIDDVAASDGRLSKSGGTILPSQAVLTFIDSLWTDGTGVEFNIDFGPLGTDAPKGLLCQDGRYRAGKVNVKLSKRYKEIGTVLNVEISEGDLYFSGNGRNMFQIIGSSTITRLDQETIEINTTDAKILEGDKTLTWSSISEIELIEDAGVGIWKDVYQITGSSNGINRNGEPYTVTIDDPLVKKVELGCAKTFIKGKMTLSLTNLDKVIQVNYDPYDDEACDNVAEAEINGKKTIFKVK